MRKLTLLLTAPLVFAGCNIGCLVEKKITEGLSGNIARVLQCSNQSAIQADVLKIVDVVKFCGVEDKVKGDLKRGPVANVICPIAASAAVGLLGNAIPAAWGCQPVNATMTLTVAVTQACEMIPL